MMMMMMIEFRQRKKGLQVYSLEKIARLAGGI